MDPVDEWMHATKSGTDRVLLQDNSIFELDGSWKIHGASLLQLQQ